MSDSEYILHACYKQYAVQINPKYIMCSSVYTQILTYFILFLKSTFFANGIPCTKEKSANSSPNCNNHCSDNALTVTNQAAPCLIELIPKCQCWPKTFLRRFWIGTIKTYLEFSTEMPVTRSSEPKINVQKWLYCMYVFHLN